MPYLTLASKACFVFSTTHNLFYCYATLQNWCFFTEPASLWLLGSPAWEWSRGLVCFVPCPLSLRWTSERMHVSFSRRPSDRRRYCTLAAGVAAAGEVCVWAGVCVCMHVCNVCVAGELPPPTASLQAKLKSGAKLQHKWCGFTWFFYLL